MPTVYCNREKLFEALKQTYTEDEFRNLCFEFGIELDDVTSEKKMAQAELKENETKDLSGLSDEVLYKIDIPANRYDLLCLEGITRALRIFTNKEKAPSYTVLQPPKGKQLQMFVKKDTNRIRPYVVCAVLRDLYFDDHSFKSFIELQDKLHHNICRKRTLVAIGTHDLDTIEGPFSYEALPPGQIKFRPLSQDKEFVANELMTHYETSGGPLKAFVPLIKDSPVYPVIYDSKRRVLSLPPIINGDHSKITLNTKNVFIECTATDYTKANIVLNTVIAMFSQYCKKPFSAESVEVVYEETDLPAKSQVTPNMADVVFETDVKYINDGIGVKLAAAEMAKILGRMQLPAEVIGNDRLRVRAPPTRSDILHPCDILEDVAIAYGYNNIAKTIPKTATTGKELALNKFSDQMRENVAQAGYLEVLTWALISAKENFDMLNREDDKKTAVILANPVSREFDVVRSTLLPGLLKTLAHSKGSVNLPVRIFECSDVVLLDGSKDVGARNNRRLAAAYCDMSSGFEILQGLLDRIMLLNECAFAPELATAPARYRHTYELVESRDRTFFPGRGADVMLDGKKIGVIGVIHPEVLSAYGISYPCSAMEIDLEVFL